MTDDPLKEMFARKKKDAPPSWDNPPNLPGTKVLLGTSEWGKWMSQCQAQDRDGALLWAQRRTGELEEERWEKAHGRKESK